jgi:hypothetical protein
VGTRTDAALAQVVAAREDVAEQVDRLEAAGRAAVDIPAKVRRSPAKAAAIAGGGAFLVLGGPRRVYRRARKAITGKEEAPLPKSLLPKEIDKALRKIGTDGDQVRGTIERDFSKYLDDRAKDRRKEGIVAGVTALAVAALRPVGMRAGRQLAERMFDPSQPGFEEQLRKVRERGATKPTTAAEDDRGPESGAGL